MVNRPSPVREVVIELAEPDELFHSRASDVIAGLPSLESGIDQIRNELGGGSLRAAITTVVLLSGPKAGHEVERGIRQAIHRYCEIGIRRAENELRAVHREGIQALVVGALVLAVGLGLSETVHHSGWPQGIRTFLGDGLFLVAAWVGMWYPLDTLIYTGRPHRNERSLLRVMQGMEIVVRPASAAAASQRP